MSLADIRSRWGQEPSGISANLMLLIKFQRLLFIHLYQLQEDEASRPECKDELSGSVSILKKYLTSITDHLADVVTVATSVIEAASVTGMVAIADFFLSFFIFSAVIFKLADWTVLGDYKPKTRIKLEDSKTKKIS